MLQQSKGNRITYNLTKEAIDTPPCIAVSLGIFFSLQNKIESNMNVLGKEFSVIFKHYSDYKYYHNIRL